MAVMAACNACTAEFVPRSTGIWPQAVMMRPITGTRNRLALPRKRGHLPANATYWLIRDRVEVGDVVGDQQDAPGARGCSPGPRQSRKVKGRTTALMIEMTAISVFSADSVLALRRPRADDDRRRPPGGIPGLIGHPHLHPDEFTSP